MLDDLRFVLTQLRRDWRFTFSCVFCLTLGITAIAVVFSLANEVLLKPLPFADPERLVMIRSANYANGRLNEQMGVPDFCDYRDECKSFESLGGYMMERLDFPVDSGFERTIGFYVSENLFDTLRVNPFLGSALSDKTQRGNDRRIMLGTSLWRQHFDGRSTVVGETIPINTWINWPQVGSTGYSVVGLLPDGMAYLPCSSWFHRGGVRIDAELPFCLPLGEESFAIRDYRPLEVIGRLKHGITIAQAEAEMRMIANRLAQQYPDSNSDWTVRIVPLHQHVFGKVEFILKGLFWGSLFILIIGCGNTAHLLLVRFTDRLPSLAIQASIGATPRRLARQLLLEALVLVGLALFVSIGATIWSVSLLSRIAPHGIPRLDSVVVDWTTLTFSAGIAAVCLLSVIVVPLRRLMTANLNRYLSTAGGTTSQDLSAVRFTRYLVTAEFGVSYVLMVLACSGILELVHATKIGLGFETQNRLTMTLSLPQATHEWNQNTLFCNEVIRRAKSLPGVKNVAAIAGLPIGGNQFNCQIIAEGRPDLRSDDLPDGFIRVITDDYFKSLQIPFILDAASHPRTRLARSVETVRQLSTRHLPTDVGLTRIRSDVA